MSMNVKQGLPVIGSLLPGGVGVVLDEDGATSKGLWLKIAKKGSGIDTVS